MVKLMLWDLVENVGKLDGVMLTRTCYVRTCHRTTERTYHEKHVLLQSHPVLVMDKQTLLETEAHARMGPKVLGAMWMGKLTVTTKIPTMETLYP
jgi:hypothetical protein